MRIIAMYLPQYHAFPENDAWWGEGYTEWTAVRRARPCFRGHRQPREPRDGYYDLVHDQPETFLRQAALAKEFGVFGFSIYQYYFCGKQLMEQPAEILLNHPEVDIKYCFCWANESWTRTWYDLQEEILQEQTYGEEADWKKHFLYNLRFFRDPRYIRVKNRPVFQIYLTAGIEELEKMKACWDRWAREAGFDGIFWIGGRTARSLDKRESLMDAWYDFEPGFTLKHGLSRSRELSYAAGTALRHFRNLLPWNRAAEKKILERRIPMKWIMEGIAKRELLENECPGILMEWDNTPRRSYKGLVYTGASPALFRRTLEVLRKKVEGREIDFVFLNAWNEWGEGAMAEPTRDQGTAYLQAVRDTVRPRKTKSAPEAPGAFPLISVISIIYKVGPFLEQCLKSLKEQTYPNLEFILVTGLDPATGKAPDSCQEIARKYAVEDSRFRIVTCMAAGAGDARNVGLRAAKGAYIGFVDGDDWTEPDMFQRLYENLRKYGTKISVCGKYSEYPDGAKADPARETAVLSGEECFRMILSGTGFFFHCWDKLFQADLFQGVEFPTDRYLEDRYVVGGLLEKAGGAVYDTAPLYHFRIRSDSLSRRADMAELNTEADTVFCRKAEKRYPSLKNLCEACLVYGHITCLQNQLVNGSFSKKTAAPHLRYLRKHAKTAGRNPEVNRNTRIKLFLSLHFLPGLKALTAFNQHRSERKHGKYSISE